MKRIKYKSAAHKKAALEAEQYRIDRDKRLGIDSTQKIDRKKVTKEYQMNTSYRGSNTQPPSLNSGLGGKCTKGKELRYTGTLVKGIAVQHKSCLQPVINQQEAIDSARMRRG